MMKVRWLVVTLLVVFSWVGVATAQSAADSMKQGDTAWAQRGASDQQAQAALTAYEQAVALEPQNVEALSKVARACYYLGRFAAGAKRDEYFKKGMTAAGEGCGANSNHAGCHYWYAANLAKFLETKGITTKLSKKGELEQHVKKALALDPNYYFGGPDRLYGMLLYKSPTASNKEAIQHLRKSLGFAPDYSLTLVSLAEVLTAEKQYDEVKQVCGKVLNLKPMPGFERELADDQKLAKKILDSLPK